MIEGNEIDNPIKLAVALMFKRSGMSASKFSVWMRQVVGFRVRSSTLIKWRDGCNLDAQDLSDRKEESLRLLTWAQDTIKGEPTESTKDPADIQHPAYGYETLRKRLKKEKEAIMTLADKPKFFF